MSQYLLLLRGGGRPARMSPEELQQMIQRYNAWIGQLHQQGRLRVRGDSSPRPEMT